MRRALLLILLAAAACSERAAEPAATAVEPQPAASATDALIGRWTGVEGMYLVIDPGDAPGRYRLEMQYDLDDKATGLDGAAARNGITFSRNGEQLTLTPSDGAATGLKYLDGKKDCLTVRPGEGYCRD